MHNRGGAHNDDNPAWKVPTAVIAFSGNLLQTRLCQ
jgi:hypothetical protein